MLQLGQPGWYLWILLHMVLGVIIGVGSLALLEFGNPYALRVTLALFPLVLGGVQAIPLANYLVRKWRTWIMYSAVCGAFGSLFVVGGIYLVQIIGLRRGTELLVLVSIWGYGFALGMGQRHVLSDIAERPIPWARRLAGTFVLLAVLIRFGSPAIFFYMRASGVFWVGEIGLYAFIIATLFTLDTAWSLNGAYKRAFKGEKVKNAATSPDTKPQSKKAATHPVTSPQDAIRVGSGLRWFLINWLAASLYWCAVPWLATRNETIGPALGFASFAAFGLFIGWAQSFELPKFLQAEKRAWIIHSGIGGAIGLALGIVTTPILTIFVPMVYGLGVGLAQWRVLRRKLQPAWIWVPGTALSYLFLGLPVLLAFVWDQGDDVRGIITFGIVGLSFAYSTVLGRLYQWVSNASARKVAA